MLGRRDDGALDAYEPGEPGCGRRSRRRWRRRSLFDSFVRYLATQGLDVPAAALERDVTLPAEPIGGRAARRSSTPTARDGEAAQVAERLVDLDEGVQEWRYRHVKMVERTIGDKAGTGGSSGARTCARRCSGRCSRTSGPCARRCERARSRPRTCAASPNPLAADYARFRVGERLLLSGHSHQAWPDVALEGVVEAFEDAARDVDEKWGRAFAKADAVRAAVGALLGDPGAPTSRSAQNTHELVLRFLSALDLARAAAARHDRRRVPHAAPPARAAGGGRARRRARRGGAGGHAGRAARRRRRRPHRGRARLGRPVRDGADRAGARRARARVRGARGASCSSTSTTRVGPRRVALPRARARRRRGSSAAATSTCSSARATASCACRRRRPRCAR